MKHDVWSVQKWLGYLFEEEVIALQKFASELPDKGIVINIGAGGGTSGLLFAEVIGKNGYLITIDVQDESSPFGCLEGERAVFESAGLRHLWGRHWFQIHGDSKEIGDLWDGPQVDLVFIDGDHTYEGCAGDIEKWIPHIKPGGYLAVHDYNKWLLSFAQDGKVKPAGKVWWSVDRAVNDLLIPHLFIICQIQSLIVFEIGEDSAKKVLNERESRRQDN